jgi:hypothetical protein
MSILKAILHRWNKNTKTYDTIHPETETSQITDFNSAVDGKISTHNNSNTAHSALFNQCEKTSNLANDIVTKLAQTTAISVISALQTNSWFGQLLKLVLNASGMKYLIDTNGYICFGNLFGGLIIQWGTYDSTSTYTDIMFPITFPSKVYLVNFTDSIRGESTKRDDVQAAAWNIEATTNSKTRMLCLTSTGIGSFEMIAVGK